MKRLFLACLLLFPLAVQAELVLRHSTASQTVLIGPFVDSTDGNTPETGLTIDASDVRLSKNGADIVGKNSGGCTHDELGYYACTFDADDTDTVGRLQVMVHKAGALPVYHEFMVAEQSVFDSCCATGAEPVDISGLESAVAVIDAIVDQLLIGVNVSKINGSTISGDGLNTPFYVEEE